MTVIVVLLPLILAPQEPTAAETFAKIRDRILKARTLEIEFDWGYQREARKTGSWGTLRLKDGNKVYYEEWASSGQLGKIQQLVVSDGSKIRHRIFRHEDGVRTVPRNPRVAERDTPKDLNENILIALSRAGSIGFKNILWSVMDHVDSPTANADNMYRASEFAFGSEDKGGKTLTYKLSVTRDLGGNQGTIQSSKDVTVWYEPKTQKLLKTASLMVSKEKDKVHDPVFDVFEKFVVDGEIPDDRFKLPPEDK